MRHHVLDLVGLPRDPGGEDVGVVTAGDRRQRLRLADARLLEVVAVEAEAEHGPAREPLREAPEGVAVLVDHGHGMAF